jgi:hypothetical protein
MGLGIVRGCGSRTPGGIYLVTTLSDKGIPLEHLVVDPPLPMDMTKAGGSAQGMSLWRLGERSVILDWVGGTDYPNCADFLEEVSLFGSSRRIPRNFDFETLGPGSQHVLVHPRAVIENPEWLTTNRGDLDLDPGDSFLHRARRRAAKRDPDGTPGDVPVCPFHPFDPTHPWERETCAAWWWEVLLPRTVEFPDDPAGFEDACQRRVRVARKMPSFFYRGLTLPDRDVWVPAFAPGIFLTLPINHIEVVRDPEEGAHDEAIRKASRSNLPVLEVDE